MTTIEMERRGRRWCAKRRLTPYSWVVAYGSFRWSARRNLRRMMQR